MINFLGVILFLLPAYLIRFHILGLPTTLLEILIGLFLLTCLFRLKKADYTKLKKLGLMNWATGLFVLAAVISTAVSPDKTAALGQLKAFIVEPVLVFYASVMLIKTEADQKRLLEWLFFSASLISIFGILQYFTFLGLPIRFWGTGLEIERITSVYDYPNALALYLGPVFSLLLTLYMNRYQLFKKSWLLPAGLSVMLIALIMTFSRGAYLGVIVVAAILLFRKYRWEKIAVSTVLAIAVLLAIHPIYERVRLGLSDPSSEAHFDLMKAGIHKIIQSPILGNGLAGFPTTLTQAHFAGEILNYPHNIFLNFWLELGLLGLVTFGVIIFLVSEEYKKQPSLIKWGVVMFLIAMLIHGLVDVPYFKNDLSVLFWFAVSLFFV